VFSTLHTTDATQTINRILSFYPPHQQTEVRYMLSTARGRSSAATARRADKSAASRRRDPGNTAVRDQMRDMSKSMSIPGLIRIALCPMACRFRPVVDELNQQGVITRHALLRQITRRSSRCESRVSGGVGLSWDTVKQEVT
jgi:twitching motility protein PilT